MSSVNGNVLPLLNSSKWKGDESLCGVISPQSFHVVKVSQDGKFEGDAEIYKMDFYFDYNNWDAVIDEDASFWCLGGKNWISQVKKRKND